MGKLQGLLPAPFKWKVKSFNQHLQQKYQNEDLSDVDMDAGLNIPEITGT